MVQINFALREVNCKVVYYGPGMSGKTTNLEVVHEKAPEQHKGELTSISTDGDRTLFFDFMPLDLGTIAGMRTKFQLYTVPGQVYYNSTRKLVLQGVDGVIFVADSDPSKMAENIESLNNLEENLREYGKELKDLPHVIQFNKRDLPEVMGGEEMGSELNRYGMPTFEAVATTGQGVFPTLKVLAGLVLQSINKSDCKNGSGVGGRPSAASRTAGSSPPPQSPSQPAPKTRARPTAQQTKKPPATTRSAPRPAASRAARAPAAARVAARPAPAPASSQNADSELRQLMREQRAAPRRGETSPRRQQRGEKYRPRNAQRKRTSGGGSNMLYGVVFGILVAAVAAVVALYILQ